MTEIYILEWERDESRLRLWDWKHTSVVAEVKLKKATLPELLDSLRALLTAAPGWEGMLE